MNNNIGVTSDKEEKMEEFLKDEDYLIEVELSPGVTKIIDVKYLVMLKHQLTSNQSDQELEDALNRVDVYLFTFRRAIEHWGNKSADKNMDYEVWTRKTWKKEEADLYAKELARVESGEITKSKMNITKTHIDAAIIDNNEEEYIKFNAEINFLRKRLDFLVDLSRLLDSRGSRLQTIVNSRRARQ